MRNLGIEDKEYSYEEYADYIENIVNNPLDYYRKFLICEIKNGQKILDFGCGRGGMLKLLKLKFNNLELYGCDINEIILERNKNDTELKGIIFSIIKNNKTEYSDSFFETCFLLDVLEHVADPFSILSEIKRILRKDGKLILNTPDRLAIIFDPRFYGRLLNFIPFNINRYLGKAFLEYTHRKEFTFDELQMIVESCGFKILWSNHRKYVYKLPFLHRGSITLLLMKK